MKLFSNAQIEVLSYLFSIRVLRSFTMPNNFSLFNKILKEASITKQIIEKYNNLGFFYDTVFNEVSKSDRRNEYIYKAAIAHKYLLGYHSLNTAVLLDEFRTGLSKADLVLLNGTGTIYEIKSERDSLERLTKQIADYQQVFSCVNVITCSKQIKAVLTSVPESVGVLTLSNYYEITTERDAKKDYKKISSIGILNSLRRDEALTVLQNLGISLLPLPNTKLYQEMYAIFNKLNPIEVHDEMIKVLKLSRSQASLQKFISALPKSVQPVALNMSLTKTEQLHFSKVMNMSFDEVLNRR